MLPPVWQTVTLFNPVVYLISGFRWSFFGLADVPVGSACWRSRVHGAVSGVIWWIFRTGWRIRLRALCATPSVLCTRLPCGRPPCLFGGTLHARNMKRWLPFVKSDPLVAVVRLSGQSPRGRGTLNDARWRR
jgi:hypothetical protein